MYIMCVNVSFIVLLVACLAVIYVCRIVGVVGRVMIQTHGYRQCLIQ